ncbi:hypothetical protein AJ79_05592 [Helicocarpus griseus UAMH5409]|uniref:Uncharacterized protein n=1 Tax=Helicocarpus griseus UAMH5409 TaxID=1447875 RepID=A0A2B7XL26_9EURO|nr:hypothetical protein AJ79_05592 [Helicocarpus griseus UAMH5409]
MPTDPAELAAGSVPGNILDGAGLVAVTVSAKRIRALAEIEAAMARRAARAKVEVMGFMLMGGFSFDKMEFLCRCID